MDNTELLKVANTLQEIFNTPEMRKMQVQANKINHVMGDFSKQLSAHCKLPDIQGINEALYSMSYLTTSWVGQEQTITNMTSH